MYKCCQHSSIDRGLNGGSPASYLSIESHAQDERSRRIGHQHTHRVRKVKHSIEPKTKYLHGKGALMGALDGVNNVDLIVIYLAPHVRTTLA